MGDCAEPKVNSNTPKDEAYLQSVIPGRISLFQSIQNQNDLQRIALSSESIKITLRDGKVKEGNKWVTPYDVAKDISKSLASNALIAKVDGVLWDMSRPLERDCKLELFDFDIDEGHDTFWHSSAHILGESLEQTDGCRLCIGPCTTRGEEQQPFEQIEVQGSRLLTYSQTVHSRLKSLRIYLIKLSWYIDVVLWLISVVDHTFQTLLCRSI